ncbi:YbhB/YbcL family Raf kinase inhibitor-like protein [Shewanella marina]|uniref:YbhB/YbcL family Raf kinase inhibitor-like protein n=1 Tax=Shewanella marina TaxID=487319 RepID=UPI0005643810|nr:YbhB/YbcL family Raf kinase inhibitor-like protein [Shewanella marina]
MRNIFLIISLLLSSPAIANFTLSSPSVTNGQSFSNEQLFNQWGCTGKNISPELNWTDPPAGTKSFAITLYDPDAPTGSGWWHWLVLNIEPTIRTLAADAGNLSQKNIPAGSRMIRNDFGFFGYGGACPPPNAKPHQYHLTIYALDTDKISIPKDASGALAGYYILQHSLAKSVLIAPTNAR